MGSENPSSLMRKMRHREVKCIVQVEDAEPGFICRNLIALCFALLCFTDVAFFFFFAN